MSSSSDIEKLFEQFGGDANAYQEIGRENDARAARTRWPLLVTLDLTQPAIPAIGQLRDAKPQPPITVAPLAAVHEDTTPKDMASVTRAKAPLFTRPHRRDIPPVPVAAAQPAAPSGASRFRTADELDEAAAQTIAPVAPGRTRPAAPAYGSASTAPASSMPPQTAPQPTYTAQPAQPAQPPSILGKLFAAQTPSASPQAAAPASLNSVFDRLRGTSAQGTQAPAGTARGGFASWLTNGPRRS
ncbi:cellulose biosynthesis protein BcsP [Paraburkholderia sp. MM5384-R2]|uniref:cellulose biosynthesis protein BcsP n=1 Tax=Paraburkholderia sp. MM5384-R2 TaxID=2723097 RepID=UPI001610E1F2|nr:cellulose biosynthesis protein BcsP [Paraburkholderia sp. MM5384-R2]MBB5499275.1 hypothetical protein [Paraburkholderia sp. MM5384-R2]